MQLIITIPDDKATRVRDAFCTYHGYQNQILDESNNLIPNPESKALFLKRKLIGYLCDCVRGTEIAVASATVAQTINMEIEAFSIT